MQARRTEELSVLVTSLTSGFSFKRAFAVVEEGGMAWRMENEMEDEWKNKMKNEMEDKIEDERKGGSENGMPVEITKILR